MAFGFGKGNPETENLLRRGGMLRKTLGLFLDVVLAEELKGKELEGAGAVHVFNVKHD